MLMGVAISELHKERHETIAAGIEEFVPEERREGMLEALHWYDYLLKFYHDTIMKDSSRARIEELTRRVAILERSVRKLEGRNW